jgi:CDP-glucose 4,6-dehydratase
LPTQPCNFVASGVRELLAGHWEADVRDAARLNQAVREADPEVVFHLAAQPLVRAGYAAPRETFEVNVIGTAALLDAIRARGKPCAVVVVTSDKCYDNREQVWGYRESDALGGHDPYSASKGAAELLVAAYRRSFFPPEQSAEHGIQVATVRAGNVIGGGDWAADRLVPDLVRSLERGQPLALRNPHAVRPWQHVLEPLGGYLALAVRLRQSDDPRWSSAWNFGPLPGQELTTGELVESFLRCWKGGAWRAAGDRGGRMPEAHTLRLNIDKALTQLGWRPVWNVDQTVARTARWYQRFSQGGSVSMLDACLEDLRDYHAACLQAQAEKSACAGAMSTDRLAASAAEPAGGEK